MWRLAQDCAKENWDGLVTWIDCTKKVKQEQPNKHGNHGDFGEYRKYLAML